MKRVKRSKKRDERISDENDPFIMIPMELKIYILMKLPPRSIILHRVVPVRGLICGRNGIKMMIGNPSTGQFVSLPRVKTRRKNILSVFGYDPVNDVYKVLCMTVITQRGNIARGLITRDVFLEDVMAWEAIMSEEHQVITLGAKQKWRMIESSYKQKRSLMSFDMSSEEFNVTKLPDDYSVQQFGNLIDLWVLEDDVNKQVWSKTAAVEKKVRHVVVDGIGDDSATIQVFFDHVESYMVL
ncbi:hypothetical protein N665_0383s0196 [Sinapis alba]|nr:hypothetical protein N665_0383s0196 [Sinapis alba]